MFHSQVGGTIRLGVNRQDPTYTLDVSGSANVGTLQIGPGGTAAGSGQLDLTAGSRLTTAEPGVFEYDSTDTVLHFTPSTTQGRCLVPTTQYYRITANSAAIGPTIADFFPATSSIPLVTNGIYEIEMEVYFAKTTTGTVTWTITNSTTVTNMNVVVHHTPLSGYTAVPTQASSANTAALAFQTVAAAAFTATGTLTATTNHWARFKILLENGSSTSLRLRATSSAGTITPLRGSYWKATRIASTNAGTYSA